MLRLLPVMALLHLPAPALGGVFFAGPQVLGADDGLQDLGGTPVSDRDGTWLALRLRRTLSSLPFDFVVVRSTDAGATWSPDQTVVTADGAGTLTSNGSGRFALLWRDDMDDTWIVHSTDGGVTWSAASSVPVPQDTSDVEIRSIQLVGDPSGTLLVLYRTNDTLAGLCEVMVLRSDDDGATWDAPINLGGAYVKVAMFSLCQLTTSVRPDGAGGWMAVWSSNDPLGGTIGTDDDVLFSYSGDDGISWSAPGPVDAGAGADGTTNDTHPSLDSDRAGRWVVLWSSDDGSSLETLVSHSTDDGATWSSPATATDETNASVSERGILRAGGAGVWVVAGGERAGGYPRVSRSVDDGVTWSVPTRLHGSMDPSGPTSLALWGLDTDGAGNWIAGWSTLLNGNLDQSSVSLSAGTTLCTAPLAGCKSTVLPGKSKVLLSERRAGRGTFKWTLKKAEATALGDFGDPLTTGDLRLCVYDALGRPLLGGRVPAGGTCSGRPCWRAGGSGFAYKTTAPTDAPHGLVKLKLKAGDDGKALVKLGGRAENLQMPVLGGLDLPLTVQLDSLETAICWEATFSASKLDTPVKFKAVSD